MKKYKIQLNARAYRDLEEIFEYIANDLQSPEYAKGQTDRLWKSLKTLEIFPSSHQESLLRSLLSLQYKKANILYLSKKLPGYELPLFPSLMERRSFLMTTYEELTLIVNITLLIVAILTYVYKK